MTWRIWRDEVAESAQDAVAGRLVEAWASGLMARLGRLAKELVVTTAPSTDSRNSDRTRATGWRDRAVAAGRRHQRGLPGAKG